MVKSILFAVIGFVAISSTALAEDLSSATAPLPPGTFTTSAHSDDWKIANALSAGPAAITEHATVIDGMPNGKVLRQGSNGWTCMPDVPGRPQHDPMCADETMMKWLMATLSGKKPDIDRVGLSYMLMGEARQGQGATPAKDPSQVKEWFDIGPQRQTIPPVMTARRWQLPARAYGAILCVPLLKFGGGFRRRRSAGLCLDSNLDRAVCVRSSLPRRTHLP